MLLFLVVNSGFGQWDIISKNLSEKCLKNITPIQCRRRWMWHSKLYMDRKMSGLKEQDEEDYNTSTNSTYYELEMIWNKYEDKMGKM